ncbi:MAG TPA: cation diffusion facilitator family transporter [Ktedonobacterales bacterium]|nr:cation diffusion facilitator family transporter [Ktedonobacterales bacterium]
MMSSSSSSSRITADEHREKVMVALVSVGAAIFLTTLKLVVALLSGSLGILAEAAHSGLDLVAALMTLFAVRVADRPADITHTYGHAKVENLSALAEAGLLLLTAVWVIYEALNRLLTGQGHLDVTIWAFAVMAVSIAVDVTRSRALLRVARQLGSQALEADALHFGTDIWSSAVVIFGLAVVAATQHFGWPSWLERADALAALGVSVIVAQVSLRLARGTLGALLDTTPVAALEQIQRQVAAVPGVEELARVRVRRAGNKIFADVVIEAPRTATFEQTHELTERVESAACAAVARLYPRAEVDVVVHVEPIAAPSETVAEQIHLLAERQGVHAHDIRVREVGGQLEADFDVEVRPEMNLREAHAAATRLEEAVLATNHRLARVTTHLEAPAETVVARQEVTSRYPALAARVRAIADEIAGDGSAHEVHLYRRAESAGGSSGRSGSDGGAGAEAPLDLVLHLSFPAEMPIAEAHVRAEAIERALRQALPALESVVLHTEPEGA